MATPATDNPRYQLATLAGTDLSDATVRVGNRRLWNGYQRVLLGDQFNRDDPHMAELPELSADDLDRINAVKGFAVTLDAGAEINFRGVAFPDVDFTRLYFGFDEWFDNATLSDITKFDEATFHGEVASTDASQTSKAAPMSFKQANFTQYPPRFNRRKMQEDADWTWAVWSNTPSHREALGDHINACS